MGGILTEIVLVTLLVGLSSGAVYISNQAMSKMIELTTTVPFCNIYTDRDMIQNTLLNTDSIKVRQISDDALSQLESICINNEIESSFQGGFTYPGTKWCGPGAIARNYSDLGYYRQEDICCRAHDNCPNILSAGQCRGGICNHSPYTRSHCDCDETFRRCLQKVNTETANTIGAIFFNVVQVICFKEYNGCSQWRRDSNEIEDDQDCPDWKYIPARKYVPVTTTLY